MVTSMKNIRICLFAGAVAALVNWAAYAGADERPEGASSVVFICEHGSARSLLAATLFNRLAEQRGLTVRALSRAVNAQTVDPKVPQAIIKNMAGDGYQVVAFRPQPVTASEAASARRVVVINYDDKIDAASTGLVDHWSGVPSISLEYENAKRSISAQIESLLRDLQADR
jgi:arsenate reductase (thioredoxin)